MSDLPEIDRWRERLGRRLSSLDDANQRAAVFATKVREIAPESALHVFKQLVATGFLTKSRTARLTLDAVVIALANDRWPPEHLAETRMAAAVAGERLLHIMLDETSFAVPANDDDEHEIPNYFSSRPLTLGERKSIASRPSRELIKMAMRDPNRSVISKLLSNPKLTEEDVVFVAARRPVPPSVLAEIAMSPRFRTRSRVARTLLHNPATPVGVALAVVPCLDTRYIAKLARDNRLNFRIRDVAKEILLFLKKMETKR